MSNLNHDPPTKRWLLSLTGAVVLALSIPASASAQSGNDNVLTCSSNSGRRAYCEADTQGGVRLLRQLSGSPCTQGSTWGYDANGVWVDRGCRAEFEVATLDNRGYGGGYGRSENQVIVQGNNDVHWRARTPNARVYVQEDNRPETLFAQGRSGVQAAPWIQRGHLYNFILRDLNGNELARTQVNMRGRGFRGRGPSPARWNQSSATETISSGSTVTVRNNESINVSGSDGRVFTGVVDQDVIAPNGAIVIPRGSNVELMVRDVSGDELALDLESVTVNGQRYGVVASDATIEGERSKDSIGVNRRTGKYVGGGAVLGAIIGAIAGGGKGAAIGAGAGAAAGAGTQVLSRGRTVVVPAESLVTFHLEQPLYLGAAHRGTIRDGYHYHPLD